MFSSKISVFGQFSGIFTPMKATNNIPMGRAEYPFLRGDSLCSKLGEEGVDELHLYCGDNIDSLILGGQHSYRYKVLLFGSKVLI